LEPYPSQSATILEAVQKRAFASLAQSREEVEPLGLMFSLVESVVDAARSYEK
jgi:hypothetical protein